MKVVIYARFSSHSQTEQSIEGQLKVCYEFARSNGYTVIDEYIDRAISGKTDKRPEFLKMIEDSNKKKFNGVLVYQLDRFARNRFDSATYKNKLRKNDVRVLSAKENITDDASGILVEGLLESMAEYYSAELSQKITRGKQINAEKHLTLGGVAPLGFKIVDKKYTIDEETAPIIKMIFEMYAEDKKFVEIYDYLNSKGYRTSRNSKFNKDSLKRILRNRKYIGYYSYKGVETPNVLPKIISDELYQTVQYRLDKSKMAPSHRKANEEFILTTKLFCGKCEDMMTGISGTSKTKAMHYYYKCKSKSTCGKKNVKKLLIEDIVVSECRKLLTTENIDKIAKATIELLTNTNSKDDIINIESMIKKNNRKLDNLRDIIIDIDEREKRKPYLVKIEELEKQQEDLLQQLEDKKDYNSDLTELEIKFFLNKIKDGDINNLKYRKALINIFVNKVYLYDDKITCIFNTSDRKVEVAAPLLDEIKSDNDLYVSSFKGTSSPFI